MKCQSVSILDDEEFLMRIHRPRF